MDNDEVRRRTKAAVGKWCARDPGEISVEDKLDSLRTGAREPLRQRVNAEFSSQHGFPIPSADWSLRALSTVGDVRDFAKERLQS